jgi:hypothetical protein
MLAEDAITIPGREQVCSWLDWKIWSVKFLVWYWHLPLSFAERAPFRMPPRQSTRATRSRAQARRADEQRRNRMGLILLILVLLLLFGGMPFGIYQGPYSYHYGGGLGLVLVIVIICLLLGRF